MARGKKQAPAQPAVAPAQAQPVAEYILSFQDKKFTQTHTQHLMKIYESSDQAEFVEQFLAVFQVTICEDLKSKRADNVLAFFLAFMMACEGDETHHLWEEFFNWILNHKNQQTHVRIRMCQFIEQFLGAMNMNAVLDATICEGIERYMILNADDFSNLVRSVALNGLQRLQDPTNPGAATWKHYLFHLNDPAPNVRKAVITSICKNRFSIPKLLEHLMDKVDTVRTHLVQTLANVSYKHYKIEDRIKLIEDGLQAKQPSSVITGIQDTILVSWFAEMDRNYIKFTKNLLLESSWKEFQRSVVAAKRALKHLFSVDAGYLQYLENQMQKTENELMDSICDSVERSMTLDGNLSQQNLSRVTATFEHCIDMNRLTPDVAIYWSAALEYYQENHEDDAIFPEMNLYLRYVEAFGRRSVSATSDLKMKRRFQYVFGLLVDNLHLYDFKDECCRTFLKETSHRLILSTNIKKDTLKTLLRIHSEVYLEDNDYLDTIVRAIHEELADMGDLTTTSTRGADQELRIKHSLKVIYLLMVNRRIRKLTPLLKELFATVIFPRVENGDRKIRIWSTKCTATYAALDSSMAQTFYYKLIAQLQVQHNVPVWAVIIESIFDLLARYGIEFLSNGQQQQNKGRSSEASPPGEGDTSSSAAGVTRNGRALYNTTSECWGGQLDESMEQVNILEVLQTLYDDCSDLLIVRPIVLGFCRLILTEQCQSVELMMKLLVTFFTSDTYPELVQILGAFFVELCDNQLQDLLVIALLPTLEYVGANPNLPVDMDSVVQFVVDSTSPKSSDSGQYHLKLAHLFVETIQANDKHKQLVKIMFKYLNQLEVPEDAIDGLELERMCTSLAKCDHLKPDQVETVRRKFSMVSRKEGSTIAPGEITEATVQEGDATTVATINSTRSETVIEEEEEEESVEGEQESQSKTVILEQSSRRGRPRRGQAPAAPVVVAEQEETQVEEGESQEDVEMTEVDQSVVAEQTIASEENTTIPATPESSQTISHSGTMEETEKTVTREEEQVSVAEDDSQEEESTIVTPPTEAVSVAATSTATAVTADEGQETDCSVSSLKENHSSTITRSGAKNKNTNQRQVAGGPAGRPLRSTAIPRRVPQTPTNETKAKERQIRQTRVGSKIPVITVNGPDRRQNKRSLDRSTTMMTPDLKQKRKEGDPNVRKRGGVVNGMGARQAQSAEKAPKTPTKTPVVAAKTKSTSTPISEKMTISRVVLSPLDMSEINKTRVSTRSAAAQLMPQPMPQPRVLRAKNGNK